MNSFFTIKEATKQRHRNTIATIEGQLATLNADKQIIDIVFRDYETNLRSSNDNSYLVNKIIFFEVANFISLVINPCKNSCRSCPEISMIARSFNKNIIIFY